MGLQATNRALRAYRSSGETLKWVEAGVRVRGGRGGPKMFNCFLSVGSLLGCHQLVILKSRFASDAT